MQTKQRNKVDKLDVKDKIEILTEYHIYTGHSSINTLKQLIYKKYKWVGMYKDIENYVKRCKVGLLSKNERIQKRNKIIQSRRLNELWECDLLGRLKGSDRKKQIHFCGHRSLLKMTGS